MSATTTPPIANDAAGAHSLNRLVRRYRDALKQIAALSGVTEVRGPLEDIDVPNHMVKEGGWVPIHPRLKDGLCYAAKIAKAALDDSPNDQRSATAADGQGGAERKP